jgi:hypothetical protein
MQDFIMLYLLVRKITVKLSGVKLKEILVRIHPKQLTKCKCIYCVCHISST